MGERMIMKFYFSKSLSVFEAIAISNMASLVINGSWAWALAVFVCAVLIQVVAESIMDKRGRKE